MSPTARQALLDEGDDYLGSLNRIFVLRMWSILVRKRERWRVYLRSRIKTHLNRKHGKTSGRETLTFVLLLENLLVVNSEEWSISPTQHIP